jgi:cysteine-rich repeat protein
MVYNGNNGCGCPAGRILQGASCVSQCQPDEILDSQGNCYTCGNNQVISNGRCVCRTGYSPNSCGNCVLACSPGQFSYQGGCAVCPLNTVFNTQINGCSCPDGYYKDINGICAQVVLRPVDCPSGQYFDNTNGCVACPGSCRTCKSATQCTTCATTGFSPNAQGACVPTCGDGLILGAETCDTGNTYSSGCINCQIQPGFTCSGQPSVCRAPNSVSTPTTGNTGNAGSTGNSGSTSPSGSSNTGSTATPTSPPVASNLAPLYQSGSATINSNNVFVTLKTNPTFTFSSPTDMQNFISTRVASGAKPTVYCSQRPNPNLDTFDCLMIYPSGVPNSQFSVDFSYNYQGKTGSVTVSVDPFAVSNNRRPR